MTELSLRTAFGLLVGAFAIYVLLVFGSLWLVGTVQAGALREASTALQSELRRIDQAQLRLDDLARRALALQPGQTALAQAIAGDVAALPNEGVAVRAQRRLSLAPSLRIALGRLAQPESELPVRIRELTAAAESGSAERVLETRNEVIAARAQLLDATRVVEQLVLDDLLRRESQLDARVDAMLVALLLATGGAIILVLFGMRLFNQRLLAPIRSLEAAVHAVREGDLTPRMQLARQDEMGRLAAIFNDMIERLQDRAEAEARLRAEISRELQRSQDVIAEVVERAQELFLVLDADGVVLFASPRWGEFTGTPEDPRGQRAAALMDPDAGSAFEQAVRRAAAGTEVALRLALGQASGAAGIFDFVLTPLDPDDRRVLAVGRDMTAAVAAEERRQHSSRLEAVGQLTGGVAHDFNNLLLVIHGNLEILQQDLADRLGAGERGFLASAFQATERASQLTQSLLAYARKQTLVNEQLDIVDVLGRIRDWLARVLTPAVRLEVRHGNEALPVHLDRGQLETALLNLAINARDAMDGGGQLVIEAERVEDVTDAELFRETKSNDLVRVSVCDTGNGIPEDILNRVFEPFFTTKEVGKGSGLGLSVVQGFVRQSGGTVRIRTEAGVGTAVDLFFPRVQREVMSVEVRPPAPVVAGADRVVLLVEDDDDVSRIVSGMIVRLGYEVRTAAEAEQALQLLRDEQWAERATLVLADIVLPGAIDGVELCRRIRATWPSLPVLLTSGYPREALDGRIDETVMLLRKPYDQATLAQAIEAAVESPRSLRNSG